MNTHAAIESEAQPSQDEVKDRARAACLRYIEEYWDKIVRTQPSDAGTLIGLPRRYLVPNHDMFQEQYYWDTYFIALGLEGTPREDLVVDATENLLYLQRQFHRIPNATRYYFLGRSQPPFLSALVLMSYEILRRKDERGAVAWLDGARAVVADEYHRVWRGKHFPDLREVYHGLSRYYDINIWHNAAEAESGWDMTPRFDDRCLDFLPVDLNALLYRYECDLRRMADFCNDPWGAKEWEELAAKRKEEMNAVLWDEESGFYYDFDYVRQKRSVFRSLAGFFPLWSGAASPEQAHSIVEKQLPLFEKPYGLVTTQEWHPSPGAVPKQWAWPNGWAPLHWIVIAGLARYGFEGEARRIAEKWVDLVAQIFEANGANYEKYDVVRGRRAVSDRYPDQHGFGWTNGVFVRLVRYLDEGRL